NDRTPGLLTPGLSLGISLVSVIVPITCGVTVWTEPTSSEAVKYHSLKDCVAPWTSPLKLISRTGKGIVSVASLAGALVHLLPTHIFHRDMPCALSTFDIATGLRASIYLVLEFVRLLK